MIPGREACCILLYGDIGDYDDVRSGDIARELLEAESAYGKIDVRINSNGGDVYAGIAIFNALKNSKADITIYIDGIAASMASVIALCGKPVQMSRYSRLMLHSLMGLDAMVTKMRCVAVLRKSNALEDTLCEMYATRLGKGKDEIRSTYFDGTDHWLRADEALALGFIDGIYDADPVPEDSTPDQVYQIFNNRLNKPQTKNQMNLDELKKRPHFKNCASDEDFLREIGILETEAGKVPGLNTEVNRLTGELKVFQDKAKADEENSRKKLLDDAQNDGRIDATTRPIYENLLVKDRENGEKALEKLAPKRKVMNDLHVNPTDESPWNKRQREIKEKLNRK